jgi:prepilin-type N-terminal cleavage/methylation domain-containing protein
MLKKLKESRNEGFTIIEVMIVLAIAGLIILIVLLAIPALQRNSRNTAIRNDASSVAGGVSEFESNNDGQVPTTLTSANGTVAISSTVAGTTPTNAKTQGNTTTAVVATAPIAPTASTPSPAVGTIAVLVGRKCELNGTYTPGTAGDVSARSIAVYYTIESSNITQQKCINS